MSASKPRLLLVEQYFHPEGWGGAELPKDLTVHLATSDYDVEVICGSDPYIAVSGEIGTGPEAQGVAILRIPHLMVGNAPGWKRLLRQVWFCVWLVPLLLLRRPPDLFISQTNPPLAIPLVALSARLRRKPHLVIVMDLYPDVLFAHGLLAHGGWFGRAIDAMFGWAYRSATRVVALGPAMAARLLTKRVESSRLVQISNWSTGTEGAIRGPGNRLRSELGLDGCFVLVYSGNLGIGHEFETLIRGVRIALRDVPSLKLLMIGQGPRLEEVHRLVGHLNLNTSVVFAPPLSASRLPESIGLADLGVVTLRQGFEGALVPSKLFGYLSRGIPVLYVGPSNDTEAVIASVGCGFVLRNSDPEGVAAAIVQAHRDREMLDSMGEAGRQIYESRYSRKNGLAQYESVVRACLAEGRVARHE